MLDEFNLQLFIQPLAIKLLYVLLIEIKIIVAYTQQILLLATGGVNKLKYSHAVSMLPIPPCILLFVKVNYFIGLEKKFGL